MCSGDGTKLRAHSQLARGWTFPAELPIFGLTTATSLIETAAMARTSTLGPMIRLIRPKQWLKNLFVFAPLIFARELFLIDADLIAVRAFLAFCFTASAIYIINDMADAEADRAHPEKRHRPIASGEVSPREALVLLSALIILTVVVVAGMDPRFITILAAYFLFNLAYSFRLKEVLLLDVFIVAAGFMFRVLGGAYAIDVRVSSWLVLCSLFISLFLGFAKRRGELAVAPVPEGGAGRKVLRLYSMEFIDQLLTIAAAGTVISYALYTVAPGTIETFGTEKLIYTTVFVLYGVFRYIYLIQTTSKAENPTNAVTSDLPIIVTGLLWILSCVVLIYSAGRIPWIG
jgi:4-hydroxybenzoate polyprenyltransferase